MVVACVNRALFKLYHGEKNLHVDEVMTMSALY